MTEQAGAYRIQDAVLLTGRFVELARAAVSLQIRVRRAAGFADRDLAQLSAALSVPGQSDRRPVAPEHPSGMVTTREAAELLKVCERTVRRLAPALGGQLVGGRWLIDRQSLAEHLDGRRA